MGTVWALSGDGSLAHVPQNRNRVVRGSAYACASAVHVRVRVHVPVHVHLRVHVPARVLQMQMHVADANACVQKAALY